MLYLVAVELNPSVAKAKTLSWREWEVSSMMASSLVSQLRAEKEPTFLISLFTLLASFALRPMPQHTTAKKTVLATTD